MSYHRLHVETAGSVATVMLNRPEKHNALDMLAFEELGSCLGCLAVDPGTRAVIITGAGASFCSGIDFLDLAKVMGDPAAMARGRAGLARPFGPLQAIPEVLHDFPKPIIAAVNGFTSGIGMSLACLCDHRLAACEATFAAGFVKLGLAGELGLTYLLPRLIGMPAAMDFLFTGETMDANWAERQGLVSRVVHRDNLMDRAMEYAGNLAQMPPLALNAVKNLLKRSFDVSFAAQLESEAFAASLLVQTSDFREGITAALEKRPGIFKGE